MEQQGVVLSSSL